MKKKVVIVEDEQPLREILSTILKEQDIEVISKSTGTDLEKTLETEHPSCVLMDVNLPSTNGDEITRKIKTNPALASIPIFLMSAIHNLPERARDANADGYFFKPFDMYELISIVENA